MRPATGLAEAIASPPYDVVDRAEARRLAADNPHSFLRVSRPDLEFPDRVPPDDPAVYRRAAERLAQFRAAGWLIRDETPSFYLYRITSGDHVQRGIVGVCDVDDYEQGAVRRHEKTRPAPEADRTRHTDAIDANAGPVLLAWDDAAGIIRQMADMERVPALFDVVRPDGVRHAIWRIGRVDPLIQHFAGIESFYIADGHHRAASAARVARMRRAADPHPTGNEEYNRFLAVVFPSDQLRILPYNRMVIDLNGLSSAAFLDAVRRRFAIRSSTGPTPSGPGRMALYLDGQWQEISWTPDAAADPVAALDVSVLQTRLLEPVLRILDPRTDLRLVCQGGPDSAGQLAHRVDRGDGAAVFSLHPVSIGQLMAVADAGLSLPPKSTWFEPKLLSGLLIHALDSSIGQ